jgi:hypothetical protein
MRPTEPVEPRRFAQVASLARRVRVLAAR